MPPIRVLELTAFVSGTALLATYFGIRAWSAYASDQGIDALRQAREQRLLVAHAGEGRTPPSQAPNVHNTLVTGEPDTSLWDRKRIAQYQESLTHRAMPLAVLRIPRFDLEVPVYEGTSDLILNRGAGRIAGTAGVDSDSGNIGIAAHRDGFFRPLKDVQVGDTMLLETVAATRQYRVRHLQIVDPSDVSVLAPTATSEVTLVTCYPFYFVGSAPQRFIVHAQEIEKSPAVED